MLQQWFKFTKHPQTVFHITHYKAGSQWVLAVLTEIAGHRIITPQVGASHVTGQPITPEMIYPCVYLPRHTFLASNPPKKRRMFIIIRDLRDTLVSQYFSVRNSHEIVNGTQQELREKLKQMELSEGMLHLMELRLHVSAEIQTSWINTDHLLVRYEDLNRNAYGCFKRIFSYCGIDVDKNALNAAVSAHSFSSHTGRKRGEEDVNSHHRKGIIGDWKNYFDRKLVEAFKERFGPVLIQTGYEKDMNWGI